RLATDLSVRPASPHETVLAAGSMKGGTTEAGVTRSMYPELARLEAGLSPVPLVVAQGLAAYLGNYPPSCTEQIVSMGLPGLVLGERPEFGIVKAQRGASIAKLVAMLRTRQNADGAFGLWAANPLVDDVASIHAVHFLIEARERKETVPPDMLANANNWLRTLAG